MSECVIVALPSEAHRVNKISSEKIAHMTLLYLGELPEDADVANITEYVQHAASMFHPFYAHVERRGVLGKDNADVLFFYKQELSHVEEFRATLLQNDQIKIAYDLAEQYPSWTPHVTLGYPDAPARKLPESGIYPSSGDFGQWDYVEFDRIAIWFGDFDGPEFRLEEDRSLMTQKEEVLDFLAHYGVKGMKWGVRKDGRPRAQARAEKKDRAWTSNAQAAFNKVAQAAGTQMNKEVLPKINEKYVVEGKGIPKAKFDAYTKEVQSAYAELLDMHMTNRIGRSPSGKHELKWHTEHPDTKLPWAELVYTEKTLGHTETEELIVGLVKNADGTVTLKVVPRDDPEELIADTKEVEHTMTNDIDDFLAHYGVKGMKWGVRRDRGSSGSSSKGRANASDASSKPKKPAKRKEDLSRYSDDKLASKLSEKKGLDALSDAELSRLTKRMQLEQSYRELSAKRPREKSKGEKFLQGAKILGQSANQITEFINSPAGKKIAEIAKKKATKK